ncbi:MAG: hypothetical protein ACOC3X_02825 [Nanoarchaeota archaeon]
MCTLVLEEYPELKQKIDQKIEKDVLKNNQNYSKATNNSIEQCISEAERFFNDKHYDGALKIVEDTLFEYSNYLHKNSNKDDVKLNHNHLKLIYGESQICSIFDEYQFNLNFPKENKEKIVDTYKIADKCIDDLKSYTAKKYDDKFKVVNLLKRARQLKDNSERNIKIVDYLINYVNSTKIH